MTLKRRLIAQLSVVVIGVALLGLVAVVGVSALHSDMSDAVRANAQLRQIYTVGSDVKTAMSSVNDSPSPRRAAITALERARMLFDTFASSTGPHAWLEETSPKSRAVTEAFYATVARLEHIDVRMPIDSAEYASVLTSLADLSSQTQSLLVARQESADRLHRQTLASVVTVALAVLGSAIAVGLRQYRSIMRPLSRLREATRVLAGGALERQIPESGDREFVELATDFNAMVRQLHQLHCELETRIEIKSRELVRSERLASVGYLAAGVAHEINNPLGIITGYGERSLQRLGRGLDSETAPKLQQAIHIICDEAFRCKRITEQLLALARPADSNKASVALHSIIEDVVRSLAGLGRLGNRKLVIEKPEAPIIRVHANEGELRQVILNLLINALEATSSDRGVVNIGLHSAAGEAKVVIRDNGLGMSPATLAQVFEPFFSVKREEARGVGLGLSIVRSIVAEHGGTINAHSAGEGKGSCFTVSLPLEHGASYAEHA
jgi:signal transduction histidine kinase